MYIRHLKVKNLKLLRDVEIPFTTTDGQPRMWTVLLGRNGLCKTSILQAIALAASGGVRAKILTNPETLRDRRQPEEDVEINATFGFSERFHPMRSYPLLADRPAAPPQLLSTLRLHPRETDFVSFSHYDIPGLGDPLAPANMLGQAHFRGVEDALKKYGVSWDELKPDPLAEARKTRQQRWFVAGYGVSRTLPEVLEAPTVEDITVDRLKPLFNRAPIIGTGFLDLFRQEEPEGEAGFDVGRPQDSEYWNEMAREYLLVLRGVLLETEHLLPNVRSLELRGRHGVRRANDLNLSNRWEFELDGQTVTVPATSLSQGYQATIAWIADLVGQMFWEGGMAVKAQDMEGIVLLDELDLHLHPLWQVRLVKALKTAFPRIQFITTTHSPMVLPYLQKEELWLVEPDGHGNVTVKPAPASPALMTGSEIYDAFFGIDRIFPEELRKDLRRYAQLAGDPFRSDEEDAELQGVLSRLRAARIDPGWAPLLRKPEPAEPPVPDGQGSSGGAGEHRP